MSSSMSGDDQAHMGVDEEIDNISGDEYQATTENQHKRKRFHRHTLRQIEAMEEFFKGCPHPDKKQRDELSHELGMEPLQVKFWFQNKRTQMKTKHQHEENVLLMLENEKLKAENMRYREALSNPCCPVCGRTAAVGDVLLDECYLRVENARLRAEIGRISVMAANYLGKSFNGSAAARPSSIPRSGTALGTGPFFKGSTSKGNGSVEDDDRA